MATLALRKCYIRKAKVASAFKKPANKQNIVLLSLGLISGVDCLIVPRFAPCRPVESSASQWRREGRHFELWKITCSMRRAASLTWLWSWATGKHSSSTLTIYE